MQNYLMSQLTVKSDPDWGAMIKFIDWEHMDYIDDVCTEHFDLDYDFKIDDDEEERYIIYFNEKATLAEVQRVINQINEFHLKSEVIYETI